LGSRFEGFEVTAGIRQGCPLFPLLFATVADVMLRRLARQFPGDMIRAYADDLAMVFKDLPGQGSAIMKTFEEYARVSGLHLNLAKTIAIPLWLQSVAYVRSLFASLHPAWNPILWDDHAPYLGFILGPGKGLNM